VDLDGSRWLLGDHTGQLFVLALQAVSMQVTDLSLDALGETSIPSSLTYLDNGVVYVGSAFGDSQLVRLVRACPPPRVAASGLTAAQPAASGEAAAAAMVEGGGLEVLDTHINLGPIVDFVVVDLEHLGQVRPTARVCRGEAMLTEAAGASGRVLGRAQGRLAAHRAQRHRHQRVRHRRGPRCVARSLACPVPS
jgi:hypothetical protein